MMIKKAALFFLLQSIIYNTVMAQTVDVPALPANMPPVNTLINRISGSGINDFYDKLYALKKSGVGTINIVHIGDSHIQADMFTGEVRREMQQAFGNAGRGLVFPYQLAKTNAPSDINSFSNMGWQYNRLINTNNEVQCGVSGFCIQSNRSAATINFSLDDSDQHFNNLRFFIDNNPSALWLLKAANNEVLYTLENNASDSAAYHDIKLENNTNSFSLSLSSPDTLQSFYGVSLQNSRPGVLYHSIGINGARYDQYNNSPLFWKQLPGLNADLFIVSLGTNDAQGATFNEADFKSRVEEMIRRLKEASPNAAIIITTAADSYKGGRSNKVLQQLNAFLYRYCSTNDIGLWDMYRITHGYGSARNWLRKGLMNTDRLHFKSAGYKLQGQLLANALLKGYNFHISNY